MLLDHGNADFPAGAIALIQAVSAVIILAVVSVAVRYRTLHPLADPVSEDAPAASRPAPATAQERALGRRIRTLMEAERLYLDPEVKVAALARRLREPDYKISRAITAGLGQPNFNRLVNAYRVQHAEALLRDRALAGEPVVNIALDSGFASLGPFNRAFKEKTGMTPRAYRKQAVENPRLPADHAQAGRRMA
jgi:AraC-like DNA-binding protein